MRIDALERCVATIGRELLTSCTVWDSQEEEKLDAFHHANPAKVAAFVEELVNTTDGPFVVKAWNSESVVSKGGNPTNDVKGVRKNFHFRLMGRMDRLAAIPQVKGEAPATGGLDVATAVAVERMKWELELMKRENLELREELEEEWPDSDDDDDDDDEPAPAPEPPGVQWTPKDIQDTVFSVLDRLKGMNLPDPPGMHGVKSSGTVKGADEREEKLLRAVRRALAMHPKETSDYIGQIVEKYGDHLDNGAK